MSDLLSNNFKPSAVKKTNLCRLFHQVESLAEISDPTGHCILESAWKGEHPHSKCKLLWRRQARPREASQQIWRRFLRFVCLHPDKQTANARSSDSRLEQLLGPWPCNRHLRVQQWCARLAADGASLCHCQNNHLHCSTRDASCTRRAHEFPRQSTKVFSLPTDTAPVTAHLASSNVIVRPVPHPMTILDPGLPPAAPPPPGFFDVLKTLLPHWQASLLAHLDSVQIAGRLKQLLKSGEKLQLHLISNGGAKDDLGSFGWEQAVGRTTLWTCMVAKRDCACFLNHGFAACPQLLSVPVTFQSPNVICPCHVPITRDKKLWQSR